MRIINRKKRKLGRENWERFVNSRNVKQGNFMKEVDTGFENVEKDRRTLGKDALARSSVTSVRISQKKRGRKYFISYCRCPGQRMVYFCIDMYARCQPNRKKQCLQHPAGLRPCSIF